MKNKNYISLRSVLFLCLGIVVLSGCERDFSDDVEFATFPANGDVFIDAFSAGLDYFPFVDAGADPEAFSVATDDNVFMGSAAMRFDVPAFGNGFVGAAFNTTVNRDLSSFDALTFYAKASQAASINAIGFGISAETSNKFQVTLNNLAVSTRWEKYVIPIPDASKLVNETGMFWLAEGASFEGDEGGYILWLDEVQFEKLGTVAQPNPAIFAGAELVEQAFTGSNIPITGLTQTFNLDNGVNQTVTVAPSYFDFSSTDENVALVSELGEISIVGEGTSTISAILGNVRANGSLEVTSNGALQTAPEPTTPAANVKSIFSDAYTNDTASNFSPGFGGSTTEVSVTSTSGGDVLAYTNNNFTGIIFENTVDASGLTFMHVDVYVQEAGTEVGIQIRDIGANLTLETDVNTGLPTGDDADRRFDLTGLTVGQWTSFDIALDGDIASQKNNLGALILTGGPNFIFDNIYFYTE
ncbi:glycosyl hydrolase family 16 [Muricauda sp. 2012CJ35-5]|uniref:Glycosyl hydrolase family 16 n=1 Tax=Flagellimonas spongiicola TaxID=2942208 RepID=A0ABT0PT28_9FLAO|nr:glycosyl hydrolase family 16 [Allomuricauda spongiicola]MCL6274545.1 glycosyl hydrolase family 16 [Allomuricauda spongiicola]